MLTSDEGNTSKIKISPVTGWLRSSLRNEDNAYQSDWDDEYAGEVEDPAPVCPLNEKSGNHNTQDSAHSTTRAKDGNSHVLHFGIRKPFYDQSEGARNSESGADSCMAKSNVSGSA